MDNKQLPPNESSCAPATVSATREQQDKRSGGGESQEVSWSDAKIRWFKDGESTQILTTPDEDAPIDLFAPDPHETFSFQFENDITIELSGFTYESDETWQATGVTLWRAATYLSEYMVKHQKEIFGERCSIIEEEGNNNIRVLEIGAGLGLCGLLVHRLVDGSDVVVTDGDSDALRQLRQNIQDNQAVDERHVLSSQQLIWGKDTANKFLEAQQGKTFPLIIASDVVYSPVIVQPLWETISTLLHPKGVFLMGYCTRRRVEVTVEGTLEAAVEAGFEYEKVDEVDGVSIFRFVWKDA